MATRALTLGERIKAARQRAGLSHDRLGAVVGTSRQHLIRLEKNTHRPRPEMLARIADATGTTLAELSPDGEDDDEESDPVAALMRALERYVRTERIRA